MYIPGANANRPFSTFTRMLTAVPFSPRPTITSARAFVFIDVGRIAFLRQGNGRQVFSGVFAGAIASVPKRNTSIAATARCLSRATDGACRFPKLALFSETGI